MPGFFDEWRRRREEKQREREERREERREDREERREESARWAEFWAWTKANGVQWVALTGLLIIIALTYYLTTLAD